MKKSITPVESDNPRSFTDQIKKSFKTNEQYTKTIESICNGEDVDKMRKELNFKVRTAIASSNTPNTPKKIGALNCLDSRSSLDDWVSDFTTTVAPYLVAKIDPKCLGSLE